MDFNFPEILIICAIALIVLGPKDLVQIAHKLGLWIARMRTQINNMKVLLNEEIMQEEKKKLEETQKQLNEAHDALHKPLDM